MKVYRSMGGARLGKSDRRPRSIYSGVCLNGKVGTGACQMSDESSLVCVGSVVSYLLLIGGGRSGLMNPGFEAHLGGRSLLQV